MRLHSLYVNECAYNVVCDILYTDFLSIELLAGKHNEYCYNEVDLIYLTLLRHTHMQPMNG